ncbi:MAG: hypothetical protein U9Q63_01190 [Patescibacteria group bacterium]|nr:hypothetical protein [Patescibacteria group bacterium]
MLVDNAPNQVFWGIARRDGAEYSLDGVFTGEIKTFKVLIGDLGKVEVECIGMTAKDPNDSSILRHFYIPIEVKDERIGVYASSDGNSYPLNYPWFRTLSRLLDKEVFLGKLKPGEQIEFSFIAGSLGLNHIKQYIGALADIDLYYWAYYLAVSQDQGRIIDNMVSGAVEEWPEDFILSGYQYSLFD